MFVIVFWLKSKFYFATKLAAEFYMLIIVDSGSTKADWQIIHEDGTYQMVHTIGYNPFFRDADFIEADLKKDFLPYADATKAKAVYFYGAGCSDKMRCDIVKAGLSRIFPKAHIEVDHDLLAAARATCGNEAGVACIIGTGSNTCFYDGKKIVDNVTNLGFLLGDEGSGSHLGKRLLRAYFYRELPKDLKAAFEEAYGSDKRAMLNEIYGNSPNVYLASFAKFVSAHKDNFFIQDLVSTSFKELIVRHILKYDGCHGVKIHFIGSIAYHFREILSICLRKYDLEMGIVIQKPIDNLTNYHLQNLRTSVA